MPDVWFTPQLDSDPHRIYLAVVHVGHPRFASALMSILLKYRRACMAYVGDSSISFHLSFLQARGWLTWQTFGLQLVVLLDRRQLRWKLLATCVMTLMMLTSTYYYFKGI